MALGDVIARLSVQLDMDTAAFEKGATLAEKQLARTAKRFDAIGKSMMGLGKTLSFAVTAPLVAFGVAASRAATESTQALGQVEAALKSMGPVAGRTAEQLEQQAKALQHISTFDDDEILRKVTANLLTFGNISGEVFDRAQKAAVNLSARLGQDLQASTIQLGKALNDPIKGITALKRVGVAFTAQQIGQIKAMVAAGDAAGAQGIILKELESEFGGAAKALRDATPGADTLDAWREFEETIGAIVNKFLPTLTDFLSKALNAFNQLSPGMQSVIVAGAAIAATLGPLIFIFGGLVSAIGSATAAMAPFLGPLAAIFAEQGILAAGRAAVIGLTSAFGPFLIPLAAVAAAAVLIYQNWSKIAPVLDDFWRSAQQALGPPLRALVDAVSQIFTELWNGPLGAALRAAIEALGTFYAAVLVALGPALIRIIQVALGTITAFLNQVVDGIRFVNAILNGDWSAAWKAMGGNATSVLEFIKNRILDLLGPIGLVIRGIEKMRGMNPTPQSNAGDKPPWYQAPWWKGAAPSKPAAGIPSIGAGGGGKGGGGKGGGGGKNADEIRSRFNAELLQYAERIASADSDKARNAEEAAEFDRQQIEYARRETLNQLKNNKDYSDAQKERLRGVIDELETAELEKIERDKAHRLEQEARQLADEQYNVERDALQSQLDLAGSQAQRKIIALKILDAEQEHLRASLEAVVLSDASNDAEKERARLTLASLGASFDAQRVQASRQHETPLQSFAREASLTGAAMNEAFEQVAVNGLTSLSDGLADAIVNFKSLGAVAKQVLSQVLADLLKLELRKAFSGLLGGVLGGLSGGLGGGLSKGALKLQGFASGTMSAPRGLALVGERGMPELVNFGGGERVYNGRDTARMMRGSNVVINADFRGADAAAVPMLSAKLDQLKREIPGMSIAAVGDAMDRRQLRRG